VGFRWWTTAQGRRLGLVGSATNLADGRVEVVAEGPEPACRALLAVLSGEHREPDGARRPGQVAGVTSRWSAARGDLVGFVER
jgi:acylphosphatase